MRLCLSDDGGGTYSPSVSRSKGGMRLRSVAQVVCRAGFMFTSISHTCDRELYVPEDTRRWVYMYLTLNCASSMKSKPSRSK